MFDILLRNGHIIDGTRTPRRRGDIGIRGDRIERIGDLHDASAAQIIDVAGKVIAPGFIDVHNHSDGWLLKYPHLLPKTSQGFTTEIIMADGISYAPVNRHTALPWLYYLRSLNGLQLADYRGWQSIADYVGEISGNNVQNVATHVPYANVRSMACGFGRQPADDFQMRQIVADIRRGMEQGAVGLSTGLDYIGQHFATTDELVEACRAIRPYDGVYVTHVRYKKTLLPALREAVEIGRRAGVAVHISHLKGQAPGEVEQVLEFIDRVASQEVDFSCDVYPYQPGSTMLSYLLPYEVWEDGPLGVLAKLNNAEIRERFAVGLEAYRLDLDQIHIAWVGSRDNAALHGMSLQAFVDASRRPAADALCDLLIQENLAVLLVINEGDDRLVEPILQHDRCMLGSDGIFFPDGQVHPRVFGSATRLLGPLVRERKLMTLEDAVYKLSRFAAQRFRLPGRGTLVEGGPADVVVFDETTVADRATFDEPQQPSCGIEHVLVNGVPIIKDQSPVDAASGPLPGRFLAADGGDESRRSA